MFSRALHPPITPEARIFFPLTIPGAMRSVASTITEEPALAWQGVVEVEMGELLAAAAPKQQISREKTKDYLHGIRRWLSSRTVVLNSR